MDIPLLFCSYISGILTLLQYISIIVYHNRSILLVQLQLIFILFLLDSMFNSDEWAKFWTFRFRAFLPLSYFR